MDELIIKSLDMQKLIESRTILQLHIQLNKTDTKSNPHHTLVLVQYAPEGALYLPIMGASRKGSKGLDTVAVVLHRIFKLQGVDVRIFAINGRTARGSSTPMDVTDAMLEDQNPRVFLT